MSHPDYSALAASILKRKVITYREPSISRDRGIAIVAQAMRQSSRNRQRTRVWLLSLAAAAAAVAVVSMSGVNRHWAAGKASSASTCHSGQAPCAQPVAPRPVVDVGHVDGRDIVPGVMFQADLHKSTQVQFDSGTRMELGANTAVVYNEGSAIHRFSISRGSVRLQVAKLSKGQRFLLNAPDVEVEVRGTVFNVQVVEPSPGCVQRSQVSVEEGVVEVRSAAEHQTLQAGERWTSDCLTRQEYSSSRSANTGDIRSGTRAPITAMRPVTTDSRTTANSKPSPETATADIVVPKSDTPEHKSALALQNDLYARASTERNSGHAAEALALYTQLIVQFPSGALVESASVQRMRLLARMHDARAAAEAQRYLNRFPEGFARAEAQALLNSP
jgi:hypothetical protein